MKKIIFLLLTIFFLSVSFGQQIYAQTNTDIPQERIFVHYNTSFFLTGEQLLYKIYCLNATDNNFTNLSKVAYVALVDKDLNVKFKHKIILNDGVGQGDFFIPTTIESGNYKLVAYTKWMLNGSKNNFFQGDVAILNPFLNNTAFLTNDKNSPTNSNIKEENTISKINLATNKQVFSKREKVSLTINASNGIDFSGKYSISVRKKEAYKIPTQYSSGNYKTIFKEEKKFTNSANLKQVPEFRGELISGKIVDKTTKKPIADVYISITITGKEYVFKVSETDKNGMFYFNIDEMYNSTNAIFEIDDPNRENLEIILNKDVSIDYNAITFSDFQLTKEDKNRLMQRSIYSQIENAYNQKKQDSVKNYAKTASFFGTNVYTYMLDDYKRFPTLKETLVEITEHIYYTRSRDNFAIKILGFDFIYDDLKPLLLIDGLQILDANEIANLKTKNIKKIQVLKENYVYGTKRYNGVVVLETFNGDYNVEANKSYKKKINLFKPLVSKIYFEQKYDLDTNDRIPDFRYQLFWDANFKFFSKQNEFTFYTSDNLGTFEVHIEGFTEKGNPISVKTYFEVK
ncbi:hypothetical protein [Polaribacter sp. Hel_I_88]|uniref:hypothetical protein n=1 Tax=Polaribacter sp. Hel_I_88 TaxID=1250006 RepID=UPI0012DBCF13|nr:hypothetical protein [Polaribacter sp. Hel_I_88]